MKRFALVLLLAAACAGRRRADPSIEHVKGLLVKQPGNTAHRAATAFTLPATVRPKGIAYDPVEAVFYFSGGAAAVLRVDRMSSPDAPRRLILRIPLR